MAYANATAARDKGRKDGVLQTIPMGDNLKIYKGSLVCADATGYACYTPNANAPFLGVAYETVDNTITGHAAGGLNIRVETEGVFSFVTASADQTWQGKDVYWDDSATGSPIKVAASDPGLGAKVGYVAKVVSATEVLVCITGYAGVQKCQAS